MSGFFLSLMTGDKSFKQRPCKSLSFKHSLWVDWLNKFMDWAYYTTVGGQSAILVFFKLTYPKSGEDELSDA